MADKDEDKDKDKKPDEKPEDKDKSKDNDRKDDDKEMIPKGKFDQTYKEKKDAERRAEEAEKKLKERDEEDQRKRGEFEKLADGYKSKAETTEKELAEAKKAREEDEKVFEDMLAKELEGIPDDRKTLIPEDYSTRQKLRYINANREALSASKGGKAPEKGKPDSNGKKPDDELATLEAEREELFKKNREQRGLFGADAKRMIEVTRKITELKAAQK